MKPKHWRAFEVEHNIRPPMVRVVTICPLQGERNVVLYLSVSAFADQGPNDAELTELANDIATKLNKEDQL